MSKRELGRVEALARVRSKQLRLVDAARLNRRTSFVRTSFANVISPTIALQPFRETLFPRTWLRTDFQPVTLS